MLIIKLFVIVLLLILIYQDLKHRMVYALLFPALSVSFVLERWLNHQPLRGILLSSSHTLLFLLVQLSLLSAYFSLRYRKWTMVSGELLGWGDVGILIAFCFYFSLLNYVVFYLLSICFSLLLWLLWQLSTRSVSRAIPLAGLQAILFLLVLLMNWANPVLLRPEDDDWVAKMMGW